MAFRSHPPIHQQLGGLEAGGEVLAGEAVRVAAQGQPQKGRAAVGRLVSPVAQLLHVAHAVRGRGVEARVLAQRRQTSVRALLVHRRDDGRVRDFGRERRRGDEQQRKDDSLDHAGGAAGGAGGGGAVAAGAGAGSVGGRLTISVYSNSGVDK